MGQLARGGVAGQVALEGVRYLSKSGAHNIVIVNPPTAVPAPSPAVEEVLRLLLRGAASRHTAATRLNDTSSRSHMLLQCRIESRSVEEGAGVVRRHSMLSLVDLAGRLLRCSLLPPLACLRGCVNSNALTFAWNFGQVRHLLS